MYKAAVAEGPKVDAGAVPGQVTRPFAKLRPLRRRAAEGPTETAIEPRPKPVDDVPPPPDPYADQK